MHIQLKETQPYTYEVSNAADYNFSIIATDTLSGADAKGMRPMETLLGSLAGCSAIDFRLILEKQRQQLKDLDVTVTGARAENETPQHFTRIHLVYMASGVLDSDKAARALQLALTKYCSVAAHIQDKAKISASLILNGGEAIDVSLEHG